MFIFENCTEEEHDLLTEMALYNAEYERYSAMYEMANITLNAMKAEAEAKVIVESGNEEDYNYLVQEAEAEVAGEKKGVLSKMVEALKNFFGRILGIFKKKAETIDAPAADGTKSPDDEPVEVDKGVIEKTNLLVKAADNLSTGWQKVQGGDVLSGLGDILKVVAIPTAVAGAGIMVTVKRKDLKDLFHKAKNKAEDLGNKLSAKAPIIEKITGASSDVAKGLLDKTKSVISVLSSTAMSILPFLNKKKNTEPAAAPEEGEKKQKGNVHLPEKGTQNGGKFRIRHKGKKGANSGEFSDNVPDDIADAVNNAENDGKTVGETVEFLRENFGDKYIIEASDDGFIDIIDRPSTMDLAINSIFGYDISNEQILSESASGFDQEIAELSELFEKL